MRDLPDPTTYDTTLARVAGYFDGTATQVWERLTSDAPVSRIRARVRAGRDRMRATMLGRLPADLTGARVLDAGCGTGAATAELAARGAQVVAVDISARLIAIAAERLDPALRGRVSFHAGDMLDPRLGRFDAVIAMDSLIYYNEDDLRRALRGLAARAPQTVFTLAPRTPLLMAMWHAGRLFPRADRAPSMIPQDWRRLARGLPGLAHVARVATGFYVSDCLELRP
jgi:magnesium-protoporphyrin O-methyltransferase